LQHEKESPSNKDSLSQFSDHNKMRARDAELGRKGDFDEQREQLISKLNASRTTNIYITQPSSTHRQTNGDTLHQTP